MTGGRAGSRAADVVVVGGGVVGAATARAVARRGSSVALLERGSLSAASGSSRGTARIIAPAPYPDESYLHGGLRALEEWRAMESEANLQLLELRGALYVGSAVDGFAQYMLAAGVEFGLLSPAEVEARFGIRGLDDGPVLFQPDAGVIRADRAHEALLASAEKLGADLRPNEHVVGIRPLADAAKVRTTEGTWHCGRVVVAAGPWTPDLLTALGIDLPLTVSSQSIGYFHPPVRAETLPALMEFDGDEAYALIDPERGLKAALHRQGPATDADDEWEVVDADALARISAWVSARFGVEARPSRTEACLYTNTPDERFILERHGPVVVGSACSGQGFQFAPDSGDALARLATE